MKRILAINVDLAEVYTKPDRKKTNYIRTLAWGDTVELLEETEKYLRVNITRFDEAPGRDIKPVTVEGYILLPKGRKKANKVLVEPTESRVLKINFVDVQQGDGSVIETPGGKVILIDGGDNQLFARYLAGRFRGSSLDKPKDIDCIMVTHGDADHFAGLEKIIKSEDHKEVHKRLFIHPHRVYHNGLVKRPSSKGKKKVADVELLGKTQQVGNRKIITGLETDLLQVADDQMNQHFLNWKKALLEYQKRAKAAGRAPSVFRRLAKGDKDAFAFLDGADKDIQVEVLGPILFKKGGVEGLPFLSKPKLQTARPEGDPAESKVGAPSASHTINGHSVVLRLTFGKFNFLFSGDLNEESERILLAEHKANKLNLLSEVFKVPHHGSADFLPEFLSAVLPMVSIVSSGDESAQKEYIHPRATLMGALGKYSRLKEPLIFVTELVAFFKMEGEATKITKESATKPGTFFAFSRAAFGIVKTRTDGQRLLVYTNSGQAQLKEAYTLRHDPKTGEIVPDAVRKI